MATVPVKTVEDVTTTPKLFTRRLASATVDVEGSDVKIKIQGLDVKLFRYIRSQATEEDFIALAELISKFCILDITGLVDEDGQPVTAEFETATVYTKEVKCLTDSFVECLSIPLKTQLANLVMEISQLSNTEVLKLSFTTA